MKVRLILAYAIKGNLHVCLEDRFEVKITRDSYISNLAGKFDRRRDRAAKRLAKVTSFW